MTRVMSPDGELGDIPEQNLEAALAAGFRMMTPEDLKAMFNGLFLEHSLFKHKEKKALENMRNRRVSSRVRMRGRR